jgi:hypothetical protein
MIGQQAAKSLHVACVVCCIHLPRDFWIVCHVMLYESSTVGEKKRCQDPFQRKGRDLFFPIDAR